MPKGNPGIPKTKEHKHNLSIAHRGKRFSAEVNKKKGRPGMLNPFYNHHHSDKTKSKLRILCPPYGNTPEANRKKGRSGKLNPFYGKHHTEEFKKRKSIIQRPIAKQLWEDPGYVKKLMIARNTKPNKDEKFLERVLQNHSPNIWKYTGDGRDGTVIGGHIPDWININGKKQVIELFGEYFHDQRVNSRVKDSRTYDATIKHYQKYGFGCLIIWRRQLKDVDRILQIIRKFEGGLP